jgi:exodeoxyribonuclease-3
VSPIVRDLENNAISFYSWNVAGLRACLKKGFLQWLVGSDNNSSKRKDFICLQEVKALPEQLPSEVLELKDYYQIYYPAKKKGYSGVAIWIHQDFVSRIKNVTLGLGIEDFDEEGRVITVEMEDFTLINSYFPNGQRDHGRVPFKLSFCEVMLNWMLQLKKSDPAKPLIITGDFNTAHHPLDLANPKTNVKTTGFLPIERQWLDKLQESGFKDLYRELFPQKADIFSWWTFRGDCRARNIGWRIDYFWGCGEFLKSPFQCSYQMNQQGSDHCPVELIWEK